MSEYGNQNRGGRRGNFSNGQRGGGDREWGNSRGRGRGGGGGFRGNHSNGNWNNGREERENGPRQEYQQEYRQNQEEYRDDRRYREDNQYRPERDNYRQDGREFGGHNQDRNGFNDRYGYRRNDNQYHRDDRDRGFQRNYNNYDRRDNDRYEQRNYRQDNGRDRYPENNRDSPQRNDRRGGFGGEGWGGGGFGQRTPPRDNRNRQNFDNSNGFQGDQMSPDEYRPRGRRGRGGNFNSRQEQHNPFSNWVRPDEYRSSQGSSQGDAQENDRWSMPVFEQSGSSSQGLPERSRDISPESTSSVEMSRAKSPALSTASSTLSITPLQTPSSSCPPSPLINVLTEAANQLSLQQGTSRDTEPTSRLLVDAPMRPANRHDKEKVILTTNIFPFQVQQKTVYHYDIDMKIIAADGQQFNLSKGAANKMQRADTCVAAIRAALEAYKILRTGEATLYDGAAMLYSSESLLAALKRYSNVLYVSIADLPEDVRRTITVPEATKIAIEIGTENEFNIADFTEEHRNRDLGNLNRTHQSFFDVLTNEPALRSGKFVAFGSGRMFPRNTRGLKLRNGQELKEGINKGIVFIEPTGNRMVPALVLDSKVGQFYIHQNVINTIRELLNWPEANLRPFPFGNKGVWHKVNQFIKGMRFTFIAGGQEKAFTASGISSTPIGRLTERNFKNQEIPVLEADRFGEIDLNQVRRDWPAIVVRGKFGNKIVTSHYPMDLLMVAKNQRVPQHKIDDKPRAAKVQDRFKAIHRMVEALDLVSSSSQHEILRAFGVSVARTPLKVEGFRRKMPAIQVNRRENIQPSAEFASFKIPNYIVPGKADDVIVAFDCPGNIINDMQKALEAAAREKGIQIANWHRLDMGPYRGDCHTKVKSAFEEVAQWRKQKKVGKMVLLIYVDDEKSNSHGFLKYYERHYLTLSQHLTIRVAKDLSYKGQTRDNVLHKMNCKLGGINYSIVPDEYAKSDWISNEKSLIIGYDVAHPTGMSHDDRIDKKPPNQASVVGMSFNGAKNPETFIGDYHYQLPKKEEVSDIILTERIKWMLELFYENRGRLPENIFLIRDGVSEGQYNMVLNKEFPAFQDGVEEFKNMKEETIPNVQEWQPNYVVVVVCKRHSKRFALERNGNFQNALPGTVADDKVVRKDMTHFYMQPHRVIQGTGKFPSYHVLKYDLDKDDKNKTQDKLQAFLFALSFNHQIFAGSISLPEPTYQADEWAKRGKDLFKVYEELHDFPRLRNWNKNLYVSPPIDYEELTRHLCFKGTPLQGCRINA